jgi:hypothetical protein
VAFTAGFLDAVVGGGGLVQLPGMMILLPRTGIPTLFGTNKLVSITGTFLAATQYARRVRLERGVTLAAVLSAFAFSIVGASAVSLLHPQVLRPLVLVMLIVVAVITALRRDLGVDHAPKHVGHRGVGFAVIVGGVMGFYDGFFGPGTGTFLVFAFVSLFGFDFLSASATAKCVNVATNLAALIVFSATGHVLYLVAIPMIACNMLGSFAGVRLAMLRGNVFVRQLFLVVVSVMIAKLAWDTFGA